MKYYTTNDEMILDFLNEAYSARIDEPCIDVPIFELADLVARSIPKDVTINVKKELDNLSDTDFEIERSDEDFVTIRIKQWMPQQFYGGLFNLPYYSEAKKEVIEESKELTLEEYEETDNNYFILTYTFCQNSDLTISEIQRIVENVFDEVENMIFSKLILLAQEQQKEIFFKNK
ncbi:hypothetical protein [Gottfriedia acidiceleris]|uniref:Uncharacterized protein n=1 Tax=Gottfriedia acidiceleris TaxID=371036 RepID=A0ABY4JF12_9BACI|nr:hypothetical protein [Gottfriedia acidiceleris]UPM52440.1 hypothetical protein MY490_11345 [Gottfriedia acidiceleris]